MKIMQVVAGDGLEYQVRGTHVVSSGDPGLLIERTKQLLESLPNHRLELMKPTHQPIQATKTANVG